MPWNSLAEMIEYAKANPGVINNATAGPGTGHDLMGNLLNTMAGIQTTQVHYRGAGPALQDAIAGHVDVLCDNLPASLPHVLGAQGASRALTPPLDDGERLALTHSAEVLREAIHHGLASLG